MRVCFTTVNRCRPLSEGGEIVLLDWRTKKTLARHPLQPTDPDVADDPNPRGNTRGGKGVVRVGDRLLAGTYHSLLWFDLRLRPLGRITHPLLAGVHEICRVPAGTWAAATALDGALLLSDDGRLLDAWWPREDPILQKRYGLSPLPLDPEADQRLRFLGKVPAEDPSHTHLNAVVTDPATGEVYALLNRFGALVRFRPSTVVTVEHPRLKGSHSPRILPGGRALVGETVHCSLVEFDLAHGRPTRSLRLTDFPPVAERLAAHPDRPFNRSGFVRGLDILGPDHVLVGMAPASLLEVDLAREELRALHPFGDDVSETVHGLCAWDPTTLYPVPA